MDLNSTISNCSLVINAVRWEQPYNASVTICKDIAERCQIQDGNLTVVGTEDQSELFGYSPLEQHTMTRPSTSTVSTLRF